MNEKGDTKVDFIPVDSVRWYIEEIFVEELETEADLIGALEDKMDKLSEIAEGRYVICRFRLQGRSQLKRLLIKEDFLNDIVQHLRENYNIGPGSVWIERLKDETSFPFERENLLSRDNFISDILSITDEICSDCGDLKELDEPLHSLFGKGKIRHVLRSFDDEELVSIARNAEELLLNKLIPEGEYEDN
ncbi:MAG: hypothetical protein GQ576_02010 [Methanococcoides sp.]|nr:hypothetical protein [Methanococcoides sp.]